MGMPSRSLKLLIDFLARVTWGFCPVIAVMSFTAFSRLLALSMALPTPMFTTILVMDGISMTFW